MMFHRFYGPLSGMPWYGWLQVILVNLLWVGLLVLLVWAVLQFVRGPRTVQTAQSPQTSALEILQMRYARGEIDAATFEQMRQHILGASANQPPPQTPPPLDV
jgi:putative membrane protein